MKDTLLDKKDRQFTYNVTLRLLPVNIVAGKKMCISYSGIAFVALSIQHAMHMCRIVMCGLSGCAIFFYIIS